MMLERLWALAEKQAKRSGVEWDAAFERAGLLLDRHPARHGYDCTPGNALTFAGTGGDGVHFSFVEREGIARDDAPIVMTVPMNLGGEKNVIIGANLRDFIGVGRRLGFFFLEQLVYERKAFLDAYSGRKQRYAIDEEARGLVETLADAFDARPPRSLAGHLKKLDEKYRAWLSPGIESTPKGPPSQAALLAFMKRHRASRSDA